MAAKSKKLSVQEFCAKHEIAESEERKVRRVLRSMYGRVGRGKRWELDAKQQRELAAKLKG